MKASRVFLLVTLAASFGGQTLTAFADSEKLQKILVEGEAPDVLTEDPIIPSYRGTLPRKTGSGQLERELMQELPLSVTDSGVPGVKSTFWGVGKAAGETDVNALGIPLNSPQGGGFDFSTFPAFLWTDYRFQLGPSLGVFDPSSAAGSLTLYPWTAKRVTEANDEHRFRGFTSFSQSTNELTQWAVGGSGGGETTRAAALMGESWGKVKGPSGSLSVRKEFGRHRAQFHFLGTQLDAESRTSITAPLSHKFSTREIPVLQMDWDLGSNDAKTQQLKNSIYYDYSVTRSMGGARTNTRAEIRQYGSENVLVLGDTRIGLTGRSTDYHTITQPLVGQDLVTGQASHLIHWTAGAGNMMVEPLVRGTAMSGLGLLPEGSLGARFEPSRSTVGIFTRLSFTRKYATLADRFYVQAPAGPGGVGFRGNPALKPERNLTYVIGADATCFQDRVSSTFQLMDQHRKDGQGLVDAGGGFTTYQNVDDARVMAALWTNRFSISDLLDLEEDYTWTHTKIESSGAAFPNVPKHLSLTSIVIHGQQEYGNPGEKDAGQRAWDARVTLRASSSRIGQFETDPLPGYGLLDTSVSTAVFKNKNQYLRVGMSVDNVLERQIVVSEGYPLVERVVTLFLTGSI